MNSDQNDFEALRRLMALKRHEQPPPGYFNRLPDQIMARIQGGEGKLGFWEQFLSQFTFRPALVYSFALAAFGALTFSVLYTVKTQPQQSAQTPPRNGWRTITPDEAVASQYNPLEPLHVANWMGADNASNPASIFPSLFGSPAHNPAGPVTVSFASP
jgi:hypothetical protein